MYIGSISALASLVPEIRGSGNIQHQLKIHSLHSATKLITSLLGECVTTTDCDNVIGIVGNSLLKIQPIG